MEQDIRKTKEEVQDALEIVMDNMDLLSGDDIDDMFLMIALEAKRRQGLAEGGEEQS